MVDGTLINMTVHYIYNISLVLTERRYQISPPKADMRIGLSFASINTGGHSSTIRGQNRVNRDHIYQFLLPIPLPPFS
jgi:hypothetical protein